MKKIKLSLYAITSLFFTQIGFSQTQEDRPNVVLIYADDLGYGDLGCYNSNSKIPTPNIDKLADQGVLFRDAHAGSTICSPSRYAILTGSYSWRTSRKRGNPKPGEQPWIAAERTTLASLFKDNGYNTAAIGKWGLGADWEAAAKPHREGLDISAKAIDYSKPIYSGLPAGFAYEALHLWYGRDYFTKTYACHDAPETVEKNDGGRWYFENGISRDGDPKFEDFDMEEAQLHYIEKSVEYIDAVGGRIQNPNFNLKKEAPFFLYYAPHIPHYPIVPAKQFQGKTGMGLHGDFIYELDWAVGQIVEALERNNQLENTMIVFTSDNGAEWQTYAYIDQYGHHSNGNLRGAKRDLWEGGHKTPFIVSYPKKFPQGKKTERLVSQTDLLATFSDYLNVDYNQNHGEDSFSFLDALMTDEVVENKREVAIYHDSKGDLALRKDDWVFIYAPSGQNSPEPEWYKNKIGVIDHNEPFELFNLNEDPKQTTNLVLKYPEKVEDMRNELFKYVYNGNTVTKLKGKTTSSKQILTNPLITEPGMSDPHALVVNDTVYMFTGHDVGFGKPDWVMPDWRIYRSTDLISWQHVGTIDPKDNYMGKGHTSCWAGDIVERNGKYYWYFSNRKESTGVMVASSPEGPYVDALGEPLVDSFDPSIFVDDDLTPYIVYGEKGYKIARLKESMIALDEEPKDIVINKTTHFPDTDKNALHKYKDTYYLSCSGYYATSKNIYGPYETQGVVGEGWGIDTGFGHGDFFTWKGDWYHVWTTYRDRDYDRIRDNYITTVSYDENGVMKDDLSQLNQNYQRSSGNFDKNTVIKWQPLFSKKQDPSSYKIYADHPEADKLFEVERKQLKVLYQWPDESAPLGVISTTEEYSHYNLELEYKWGERKFAPRDTVVRDAGILFHVQGEMEIFPSSLECQIQEGDTGDLWLIKGPRAITLNPDGTVKPINASGKSKYKRGVKFSDQEKEGWNHVRVEVRGGKSARFFVNGHLVNELVDMIDIHGLAWSKGKIALQAEGAELIYKNVRIQNLK